jgi:O-antigen biosynthesis protein WbqP
MDLFFATSSIIVLIPVFMLIAVLIYFDDPGPVIFCQKRAGRNHNPFFIFKFRTMRQGTISVSSEELSKLGINPVTRVGRILRITSLDELPQLLNVIRGEMSFIGPRPALMTQDVVLSGRSDNEVDQLLPGITGLAQVLGRDDLDDHQKIIFDTQYRNRFGIQMDLYVLWLTAGAVFKMRGAR